MPAYSSSAPGKVILFGEHAVVYQRPAVAVPVTQVRAKASVSADIRGPTGRVIIDAPDIHLLSNLDGLPEDHPIGLLLHSLLGELQAQSYPACRLHIQSSIPIAAGMGSGAAVSVAILRAMSGFLGRPLRDAQVCELAYQSEKRYHGTPSGIDNTVITYAKPVYFVRGQPIEFLQLSQPVTLVIADSGLASSTAEVVGEVRHKWEENPAQYDGWFDEIRVISDEGRQALENGQVEVLGNLMSANHKILQKIGVSNEKLDLMVETAQKAGASGAKLCGAGRGGNMIAAVEEENAGQVAKALDKAGAVKVIITTIHDADKQER